MRSSCESLTALAASMSHGMFLDDLGRAVETLIATLRDDHEYVRYAAAKALLVSVAYSGVLESMG